MHGTTCIYGDFTQREIGYLEKSSNGDVFATSVLYYSASTEQPCIVVPASADFPDDLSLRDFNPKYRNPNPRLAWWYYLSLYIYFFSIIRIIQTQNQVVCSSGYTVETVAECTKSMVTPCFTVSPISSRGFPKAAGDQSLKIEIRQARSVELLLHLTFTFRISNRTWSRQACRTGVLKIDNSGTYVCISTLHVYM